MAVPVTQDVVKFPGIDADGKRDPFTVTYAGATAGRPAVAPMGFCFFDVTLGKPIWYNGVAWVDAAGQVIPE